VRCPMNFLPVMERFADSETGTSFTPRHEAVRDPATVFALLTSLRMTVRATAWRLFAGHHTSSVFLRGGSGLRQFERARLDGLRRPKNDFDAQALFRHLQGFAADVIKVTGHVGIDLSH
jgi:hypothetical protein